MGGWREWVCVCGCVGGGCAVVVVVVGCGWPGWGHLEAASGGQAGGSVTGHAAWPGVTRMRPPGAGGGARLQAQVLLRLLLLLLFKLLLCSREQLIREFMRLVRYIGGAVCT